MSQLAEQHRAVNLSQGFPDFLPPAELLERVTVELRGRSTSTRRCRAPYRCERRSPRSFPALCGVTVDPIAAVAGHERRR